MSACAGDEHTHTRTRTRTRTPDQICAMALTPSAVSDEPLIHSGRDIEAGARQAAAAGAEIKPELRGDMAVHGFWLLAPRRDGDFRCSYHGHRRGVVSRPATEEGFGQGQGQSGLP